ncbi:RING-H2 finger protein atl2 [Phtheirospermum japonicum]|uniref:RING-type E3 ubiquitin transferase n=1 Tax=Phtheirospermum japonicum TaxID=374723 RepID=A0A830DNI0_9LAMI|nr:RING-H2 finger protein atl2 [Phtheirospermum japonicum]
MLIIAAITTVFLIVLLLASLHLYARWWLRRDAAAHVVLLADNQNARTHVVVFADNHNPSSAADRGLEPAVLSSLPVFTYSSRTKERPLLECAVCLSEFEEDEMVRLLPKCNHAFHIECIDMWFHSHSTCPLCRSPVEPALILPEPSPVVVVEVAEEVSGSEPVSSSGCDLCATCQHEDRNATVSDGHTASFRRRKAMDVKIDVGPARRAEFENELTQSSPITRLLSFKRLLSMGRKSPIGGRASSRNGAETSRAATELDLESGLGKPIRVHTRN